MGAPQQEQDRHERDGGEDGQGHRPQELPRPPDLGSLVERLLQPRCDPLPFVGDRRLRGGIEISGHQREDIARSHRDDHATGQRPDLHRTSRQVMRPELFEQPLDTRRAHGRRAQHQRCPEHGDLAIAHAQAGWRVDGGRGRHRIPERGRAGRVDGRRRRPGGLTTRWRLGSARRGREEEQGDGTPHRAHATGQSRTRSAAAAERADHGAEAPSRRAGRGRWNTTQLSLQQHACPRSGAIRRRVWREQRRARRSLSPVACNP